MILVGSYNENRGIYKLEMEKSGELRLGDCYISGENPSYLIDAGSGIVSVNEISEEENISHFHVDPKGNLVRTGSYRGGGDGPCYLQKIKEDLILCSNYDDGSLSLLKMDNEKLIYLDSIKHEGSSIITDRQEASHIHSTAYHEAFNVIYCIDLGTDEIISYQVETNFKLNRISCVKSEPGDGPRLMVLDESVNIGYVINELSNTISIYKLYDDGSMKCVNRVSTLPEKFSESSFASHIEFSPCKKFLLASNRGHDSIVVFKIENMDLKSPKWFPTEGKWPRHFTFCDDNRILVANQNSNCINSFSYSEGELVNSGYCLYIDKPTMILSV